MAISSTHQDQGHTLNDWRPEDKQFWEERGRQIATRNLWISIPALLLAFSVWMVWSVVVAKLPAIGFAYTTDQLFWLACPAGTFGRDTPHLLFIYGPDFRRPFVDDVVDSFFVATSHRNRVLRSKS